MGKVKCDTMTWVLEPSILHAQNNNIHRNMPSQIYQKRNLKYGDNSVKCLSRFIDYIINTHTHAFGPDTQQSVRLKDSNNIHSK